MYLTDDFIRYHKNIRPFVGSNCMFSAVKNLLPEELVTIDHPLNNKICTVLANTPNTVRIQFAGTHRTDITAPEFLTTITKKAIANCINKRSHTITNP